MITPLEIENKRFAKQMVNGYSTNEVDNFLDELTLDYSKLYKENAKLKNSIEELNQNVGQYKSLENTLQNTLVMAQKTANEIQSVAKQQAEQIIKDAEFSSRNILEELEIEINSKKKELYDLKQQMGVYRAKTESLLISQLELLKDMEDQ